MRNRLVVRPTGSSGGRRPRRLPLAAGGLAVLALTAAGLPTALGVPAAQTVAPVAATSPKTEGTGPGDVDPNYDSRDLAGDALAAAASKTQRSTSGDVDRLARRIGGDATVSVDALTGTPSDVSSRLGFLTGPSSRGASSIALGYVRANLDAFGLTSADLGTLVESRRVTDLNGITHVFWTQQVDGVPVFGNGLRAHVDRRGRLISVQGAPVSGLGRQAARTPATRLDAAQAIDAALDDSREGATTDRGDATAERVLFLTAGGLRPAWATYTQPGDVEAYQHVIDAATGRTLFRRSTVNFERGDGLVHENYPGARGAQTGGKQHVVNLFDRGYLPRDATWLKGRWASVWADVNDDDKVQKSEKSKVPSSKNHAQFLLRPFATAAGQTGCKSTFVCTWNPNKAFSWRTNKNQDGVQALYFTSKYAEWLSKAPFGFTPALGNFERAGGDPVRVHTMDGADTDDGLPDSNHVNNANFNTPPDGTPPVMQMYLNRGTSYLAASSSNAFDNIGHEYTHGLSNRLVVDSQGTSTLNSYQGGAMGEGWSDFYSFDYLEAKGFLSDNAKPGQLMYDRYLSKNRAFTRTMAIDCGIGQDARLCQQVDGEGVGGYTYGDIPRQLGTEVHSASEVWSQTLWQLRRALGHQATMRLVTSAMTLSPDDPSMLDMRDAILTADKVIYSRRHTDTIWSVFAKRGFGYFAASVDGADADPVEDFHRPPSNDLAPGSISGTVSDLNGNPLVGAVVLVAGHTSSVAGNYSATTRADGSYDIDDVVPGRYPKVVVLADGYEGGSAPADVEPDAVTTLDFQVRRDWASEAGGASVASFDGPDYSSFGCGPGGAIDLSLGTGWGSETTATGDPATSASDVDPKSIVIELPQAVDITSFGVDPAGTCGDDATAGAADYRLEVGTSADGPFTEVASGTFTTADQGGLVDIIPVAPTVGTTFVRYTMLSPQVPDFADCPTGYDGCTYMDTTEVAVYDD